MFDEMSFLFEANSKVKNSVNTNTRTASSDSNRAQVVEQRREYNKKLKQFELNEYVVTTSGVRENYIQADVNKAYDTSKLNPYLQLLDDFSGASDSNDSPALKLKSTDFSYLRDIGVFPINRLMILRRFEEGVVVPKDLQLLNAEPVSTVIGWVKDENEFLSFNFNEVWVHQGSDKMLHLLLNDMISKSFGIHLDQIVPIPGWGIGFVFGILNRLGITDYNKTNLPIGDPNVLKQSITRDVEEFGLNSNFSFKLETVYEQKYIGDIDMTVSTMEILNNLLIMGTSDTNFIGKTDSKIIANLRTATNDPTNLSAWVNLISKIVTGFISAIAGEIRELISGSNEDTSGTSTEEGDQSRNATRPSAPDQGALLSKLFGSSILKSILKSTVGRYVWPLRGSIAMLTGEAATPWHLTIGNPYAPLFSMNNVHVSDVAVKHHGEMQYNDIPQFIDVTVDMKQGRSMGKQEIYDMFGINYKRVYKNRR